MGGFVIIFNSKAEKVIQNSIQDSKILLKGPTGCGKSTVLLERYKYLVEHLKVPSEKILVLLLNKGQALEWTNNISFEASGTIWRTSYYSFIQTEIEINYPTILKKNNSILNKSIKPVFLSPETAQFLVSKAVEGRRNKSGAFAGITTVSDRIASDLTANLVKAAISDIPHNEIGERLFNSLEKKDAEKKQLYLEGDIVSTAYRNKCIELGIFDFGMAVDLFNNFLLTDENYKTQLFKRVRHLIVDNIEECVPTEIDLIEFFIPNISSCLLGYNNEGGFGELFGSNHEYMKQKIIGKCEIIELNNYFTCKDYMAEFSEMLFDNIENLNDKKHIKNTGIERIAAVDLRSEMLETVAGKVLSLIKDEGYRQSDIVILSTYADLVTEYVIGRNLEKEGYQLKNLSEKNRVIDNPITADLITLAKLCHPSFGINPNRDEVKAFLSSVIMLDPIRSSILAGQVCNRKPFVEFPGVEELGILNEISDNNIEKYKHIRNWVINYKQREKPLAINEFFQRVFLEILISEEVTESEIIHVKKMIDSAQTFVDVVSRFNNINVNKGYIEMVQSGIKVIENIFELDENIRSEAIYLSTPIAYLSSPIKNKVTILTSISSNNWSPRSIKEMANAHVLTKTWEVDKIYTEEQEEQNQKHYLAVFMRAILKRCGEKLITFESNLSANGYENDGILSEYFEEILG